MSNNQKKGLGMGLSGLMSSDTSRKSTILEIDINIIKPNPKQPRDFFDEDKIQELAQSIKENGLIQPVLLVKNEENSYHLIAGERRFRAVKSLGHKKIKAILVQADEASMIKNALIENIQREDLTTMEEALGYDMMIKELNLTHQEVAEQVGKSRSHVSNMVRILSLPNEIIDLISKNKISFGHAKVLLSTDNPLEFIEYLKDDISVRKLEDIIKGKIFHSDNFDSQDKNIAEDRGFFKKKEANYKQPIADKDYLENIAFTKNVEHAKNSNQQEGSSKKLVFNLIKDIYSKEQSSKDSLLHENLIDSELDILKSSEDLEEGQDSDGKEYGIHIKNLEHYIKQKIGLDIRLDINIKDSSGSINISYKNFEELEKILSYLF